jgi:hypothetical protein
MQYTNITKIPSVHCQCVLYGCETWSLTLREECRLRVFENKVLRRIFQYVACMGEGRVAYRGLVGKPEGKNHLEGPGVDGRIILKRIFRGMGLIWL